MNATNNTISITPTGSSPQSLPLPEVGVAEFSRLYTTGQLTLGQAVLGCRSFVSNAVRYSEPPSWSVILQFLCHRMHPEDIKSIEIGYNGSVQKWLDAGNLPRGWYSLFKDNYSWYNTEGELCIPQATEETTESVDALDQGVPTAQSLIMQVAYPEAGDLIP